MSRLPKPSSSSSGALSRRSSIASSTDSLYRFQASRGSTTNICTDWCVGQRVLVSGGRPGRLAYLGETRFAAGEWAGVVLEGSEGDGKNDGSVAGVRYFTCPPNCGIFCRPTSLKNAPATPSTATPRGKTTARGEAKTPQRGEVGGEEPALNCRVLVPSSSCGVRRGILRYLGNTQFASGRWAGIELDSADGKNDGSVAGVRYFRCAPNHGLFAPARKIISEGANSSFPASVQPASTLKKQLEQREEYVRQLLKERDEERSELEQKQQLLEQLRKQLQDERQLVEQLQFTAAEKQLQLDNDKQADSDNQQLEDRGTEQESTERGSADSQLVQQLKEQLKTVQDTVTLTNQQLLSAKEELQQRHLAADALTSEAEELRQVAATAAANLHEKMKQILLLQQERKQCDDDSEQLRLKCQQLQEQTEELQFKLEELRCSQHEQQRQDREQLESLRQELRDLNKQLQEDRMNMTKQEQEMVTLRKQVEEDAVMMMEKEKEMEDVQTQLFERDEEVTVMRRHLDDALENKEQGGKERVCELQRQLAAAQMEAAELKNKLEELSQQSHDFQHKLAEKERAAELYEKEREGLNASKEEQLSSLRRQLSSVEATLANNQQKSHSLQTELEAALARVASNIDNSASIGDNLKLTESKLEAKNNELRQLTAEITALRASSEKEQQEAVEKISRLETSHQDMVTRLQTAENVSQELEKRLAARSTDLEHRENLVRMLQEEKTQMSSELSEKLQTAETERHKLQNSVDKYRQHVEDRDAEISRYKRQVVEQVDGESRMQEVIAEMEQVKNTLDLKNDQLKEISDVRDSLSAQVNQLQESLQKIRVENSHSLTLLQQCRAELSTARNTADQDKQTHAQILIEKQTEVDQMVSEMDALKHQLQQQLLIAEKDQELKKSADELEQKQAEKMAELNRKIAENEAIMQQSELTHKTAMERLRSEYESEVTSIKEQHHKMLAEKNDQIQQSVDTCDQLQTKLAQNVEDLCQRDKTLESLQKKIQLNEQSYQLEKERSIQLISAQLQAKISEFSDVSAENEVLQQQIPELQNSLTKMRSELEASKICSEALQKQVHELEQRNVKPATNGSDTSAPGGHCENCEMLLEKVTLLTSSQTSNRNSDNETDFLNSVIADLQVKNQQLEQRLVFLATNDCDNFDEKADINGECDAKVVATRLWCDICEVFDAHDTEDCALQNSAANSEELTTHSRHSRAPCSDSHSKRSSVKARAFCINCEMFGHPASDCPNTSEMF